MTALLVAAQRPNPSQRLAAIESLEAAIAHSGPALRADGRLYRRAVEVLEALRAGTATVRETQLLSIELMRWHLQAQRREFLAQLEAFEPLIARGETWAMDAAIAVKSLLQLVDQVLVHTSRPESAPAPQAAAAIDGLSRQASAAVSVARASIERTRHRSPRVHSESSPRDPGGRSAASTGGISAGPTAGTRVAPGATGSFRPSVRAVTTR